jgi:hypothetical protein
MDNASGSFVTDSVQIIMPLFALNQNLRHPESYSGILGQKETE